MSRLLDEKERWLLAAWNDERHKFIYGGFKKIVTYFYLEIKFNETSD